MKKLALFSLIAAAGIVAAPAPVDAAGLPGSAWALTGKDRLAISGFPASKTPIVPTYAFLNATQRFVLNSSAQVDYIGTWAASGKRGFKVTPDQASIAAIQNYLVAKAKARTGASSVTVEKLTIKITGSLSKNGKKISMKSTFVLKGHAVVGGKSLPGTATETDTVTGTPVA